jgi:hypothetical protein
MESACCEDPPPTKGLPMSGTAPLHIRGVAALLRKLLSEGTLESIARETRFVQRKRIVTAGGVFWAFIVTLGAHSTEYISDVLRALNAREGLAVRYKPFWNRLARRAFPMFMKTVFLRMCRDFATRTVERYVGSVAGLFSEILIDDGSSFAVADGLRRHFPGRFTTTNPAAIELHAHMDLLSNNVRSVTVAPDKEGERRFLPSPESLPPRSLSLRDRGYVDLAYFEALARRGAFMICRAIERMTPTIEEVLDGVVPRARRKWCGRRLKDLGIKKLRQDLDLIVRFDRQGEPSIRLRLVIRAPRERKKKGVWLLTNVPRTVPASDIALLYRLRWQIELLFKDWKSYANLRGLETEHASIA